MLRIAYARVSTSSGEQLSALETQRQRLAAESPDLELVDVESGLSLERRHYQQLKNLITHGQAQEVIATRLDRLGRDATESDAFVSLCDHHGVICRTLDDGVVSMATPEALLLTRLRGSLSQGESMKISARVNAALQAGRAVGKPMRKPCWGYRLSPDRSTFELDPIEAPKALAFLALLKAMRWRMQPAMLVFDQPIPIKSSRGVRAWLLNPTIRGAVAYRQQPSHQFAEILWDRHPALLSHADYAEMEAVINRNRSMWGTNATRTPRPLTGLCLCCCGHRMKYVPNRTHPALRCGNETCPRRYRSTREAVILTWTIEQLRQHAAASLAAAAAELEPPEAAQLRQQIEALERQNDSDLADAIERKRIRLASLLSQPATDPDLTCKIADPQWWDQLTRPELTELLPKVLYRIQLASGVPTGLHLRR